VRNETPEYYSPPLYFSLAGGVTWIGRQLGLGEPHKLGQFLNVPLVVGAVLLAAALARLLWPERRWLAPTAAAYVALSPVLMRTAAMFHPEPADLFASVLAAYLAARILVQRRYGKGAAIGLGVALGANQMVRQFGLYTLAVVALVWLAALWGRTEERRALFRTGLVALAACAVVAGPWYGYRVANYANAVFDRPHSAKPLFERQPARFYLSTGLPGVFTQPYRPHLQNLAWPETYSDIWGDWYGVFNWSLEEQGKPSQAHVDWLVAQNAIGILPTAIALVGWLALLGRSLRRRSPDRPARGADAARGARRLLLLRDRVSGARRRRAQAHVHALLALGLGAVLRVGSLAPAAARRPGAHRPRATRPAVSRLHRIGRAVLARIRRLSRA